MCTILTFVECAMVNCKYANRKSMVHPFLWQTCILSNLIQFTIYWTVHKTLKLPTLTLKMIGLFKEVKMDFSHSIATVQNSNLYNFFQNFCCTAISENVQIEYTLSHKNKQHDMTVHACTHARTLARTHTHTHTHTHRSNTLKMRTLLQIFKSFYFILFNFRML